MFEYAGEFLSQIWRIFTSTTLPGTGYSFASIYILCVVVAVLGYVVRVVLRIDRVGNAYRHGKNAYQKHKARHDKSSSDGA